MYCMKIAVCGSGKGEDKRLSEKVRQIGEEIAKLKAALYTGGCWGYPYEAAKACFNAKGRTIAISPAKDLEEHKSLYNFPSDAFSEYIFTGLGIPERNYILAKNADAVIIIGGQIGTLNEFTVAFHEKKAIGVLKGSKGITGLIPSIAEACNKMGEREKVIYDDDPKELVRRLVKQDEHI